MLGRGARHLQHAQLPVSLQNPSPFPILLPMAHSVFSAWDGELRLVTYPAAVLVLYRLSRASITFLATEGFPGWAAPHLHFDCELSEGRLVPPTREDGQVIAGFERCGSVGSAPDGPIILDPDAPEKVFVVDGGGDRRVLASSVLHLAHALAAVNLWIQRVLDTAPVADAWRRGAYPLVAHDAMLAELARIDPVHEGADAYLPAILNAKRAIRV